MNKRLKGNTATMVLANCFSITIKICEDCETLEYQFNNGNIQTASIHYVEREGESIPAFKTEDDTEWYYLEDFCRDNLGGVRGV